MFWCLDCVLDVQNRQPIGLELVRIQPDPHAVRSGTEDRYLTDSGQTRDGTLQIDDRVIAQERFIEAIVVRIQAFDQQDIGADLLDVDSLGADLLRQLRQRAVDRVLHQSHSDVEVGADGKGNGERVAAVAAAGGLHVDRILDAVDALLDGNADGVRHRFGAGAGIAGAHLNRGRDDLRILGHRQVIKADGAQQDRDDGDDVGEDRPLDEEFRHAP